MTTVLCWTLAASFFSLLILYTVGRTPWTGYQPVARPLPTHRTTQTQNKRTQTSTPCDSNLRSQRSSDRRLFTPQTARPLWSKNKVGYTPFTTVAIPACSAAVSKTKKGNQFVLRRIRGSHSGRYEELYILGYNAMQSVESRPTFRRNMPPPFSRWSLA
jgi:hypothetical protein